MGERGHLRQIGHLVGEDRLQLGVRHIEPPAVGADRDGVGNMDAGQHLRGLELGRGAVDRAVPLAAVVVHGRPPEIPVEVDLAVVGAEARRQVDGLDDLQSARVGVADRQPLFRGDEQAAPCPRRRGACTQRQVEGAPGLGLGFVPGQPLALDVEPVEAPFPRRPARPLAETIVGFHHATHVHPTPPSKRAAGP